MTYITTGGTLVLGDGYFGDGSGGDVVYAADTTLVAPVMANNLTINAGIALTVAGFPIFVKETLTIYGSAIINANGGYTITYAGGAAAVGVLLGGGAIGGAGNTDDGVPGGAVYAAVGGVGGHGGAGIKPGGPGGTVNAPAVSGGEVSLRFLPYAALGVSRNGAFTGITNGGSGGGSGGGDATRRGGGGGGGAGAVVVVAKNVVWGAGAKIQANGGHGGDGEAGGEAGGGGGGGGGLAIYVYRTETGVRGVEALGGSPGLGVGAGAIDGLVGNAGQTVVLLE